MQRHPPALRVVKPLATAVRTARPTFEWTAIPGASSYRVRIANASLDPVAESPALKTTNWTPETPLPAGRVLMWQVEAQTPRGPIVAPAPPAPEARILVLRSQDAEALRRELNAAKNSDLAAAVALARFGILDEADAALARLADANSNADAIARLRQQLSDRRFPR